RSWLGSDHSHVFHLIVDELHTYRGTQGTEVAYIIRVLSGRLGLTPDSPQLRIIASSASIGGGPSGLEYLEAFFGRNRDRFDIISSIPEPVDPTSVQAIRNSSAALTQLRNTLITVSDVPFQAANAFRAAVGAG